MIRSGLAGAYPLKLVEELLDAHREVKRNYSLGGLRLAEVEGGRFAEAAFRILEIEERGSYTALGSALDTEALIHRLGSSPATRHDSVRLHIPRSLRLIYDIRNKRDAAHLADGIDPNLQDATLVVAVADWILAELVRIRHDVSADAAHKFIDELVTRVAPAVEDFDGFLKVLRTDLQAGDFLLVLLYQRGKTGASVEEVRNWVRPDMRKNLDRTVDRLVNDCAWVHRSGANLFITLSGVRQVEARGLVDLSEIGRPQSNASHPARIQVRSGHDLIGRSADQSSRAARAIRAR